MKEFWERQAVEHGEDVAAVNFDPIQEELSAKLLDEIVPNGIAIADLGCGNGRALIDLAISRIDGKFVGYDFAENMVRVAELRRQTLALDNLRFFCFDATAPSVPSDAVGAFDMVISKRLLINIKGPAKEVALRNIHTLLKPRGTYLMIECHVKPLERINEIRCILGLDPIEVRPFNEYLTEEFLGEVCLNFTIEKVIDYGSLYYFASRIFNAAMSEGKPDYHAPINQLASKLTRSGFQPMSGYSPEICHVMKKINGWTNDR